MRWIYAWIVLVALTRVAVADAERDRLQQHFATVDRELRDADVSALTVAQRARRAGLIDELARYRARGVFPRNLDFAARTPYFIDDRGIRCAMAHLIETFGGELLVAHVATVSNNAYVRELAVDDAIGPALAAWLEHHGLSVAEAARIQPAYSREHGERCYIGSSLYVCMGDATCTASDEDPTSAYCSPPCDPAAGNCPTGLAGVQMECLPHGDEYRCMYLGVAPGSTGWACDASTAEVCEWACVGLENPGDVGSCAPPCSDSQACPVGYECEPRRPDSGGDYLRTCMPITEEGGCSTTGHSPPLWLLGLLLLRRRRA